MWRRIMVALAMLGGIAFLGLLGLVSSRYEGCGEDRVAPPKPACDLPPASTRVVIADLVRTDPKWRLARDDDAGALALSYSAAVFVLPPMENREPATALATFVRALPPDVRTALRRAPLLVVWLGHRAQGARYPAWDTTLDVQVFHDVLTPDGCLARVPTTDDPEDHTNRHHANEHAETVARVETALARGLRTNMAAFSSDESAARIRVATEQLHTVATAGLRETYAPLSAILIAIVVLVFYWWAASAGKEDSMFELCEEELRGDGALVAPGRFDVRVLSHSLLHKDLKHLMNNLFALWIGCAILEPAIGSARTLIIFLAGVVGGAIVRLRLRKPGLAIGASGGAFALETAALVLLLHSGTWFVPDDRSGYILFLGIQLALGLVVSFLPGVSMAAHVGGALAGFALTITGVIMLGRPPLDGGPESSLAAGIAWAIAGLGVALWIGAGVFVQRGRTDLAQTAGSP